MAKVERGLGRGLDALFGGPGEPAALRDSAARETLPIGRIVPNQDQPRKAFDQEALRELAESIRSEGVLQPLLVRPLPDGNYEIVAGERRWRASQMAGLSELPVIVKDLDDEQALAIALIENLQREDLNPMEEALGYKELRDKFNLSQNEIATRVGKSRSAVANTLRLLQLPLALQEDIINGEITQGHARPLLGVDDEHALRVLREEILGRGASVRDVELWVADWKDSGALPSPAGSTHSPSPHGGSAGPGSRGKRELHPSFPTLEGQLAEHLGLKAVLRGTFEKGSLKLAFSSKEEFGRLLGAMGLTIKE